MNKRAIYVGDYEDFGCGLFLNYGMTGIYNTRTRQFTPDGGQAWCLGSIKSLYFPR